MRRRRVFLHTHCFIEKSSISEENIEKLKVAFTVNSKYHPGEGVKTWKETRLLFGIPLYHKSASSIINNSIDLQDRRVCGLNIKFDMTSKLRKEQVPVIDKFVQSIANGTTGIILNGRTGFGKTVCLLNFIQYIGKTTLIIVPRDFIVDQWINRIIQHTSIRRQDIGIARQDICQYKGKKIVVGMIHSLCKDKYPKAFKDYFGCIVWDEVHVAGAGTFSETVNLYSAKYRLAATATLTRKDGMTPVYVDSVGQEIISVAKPHRDKPIIFKLMWRGLVGTLLPSYFHKVKDPIRQRGMLVSAIAKDHHRTHVLCSFVERAAIKGRKILVLSERVNQLHQIKARLDASISSEKIGVFIQSTPRSKRQEIVDTCQIVLATYQIFSMAVDLSPEFSMLVMATPVADAVQSVGRIMREMDGKKRPIVLDVMDVSTKNSIGWYKARAKLWESMGADIYSVDKQGHILEKLKNETED